MGKPLINMLNQRFGRLVVIAYTGKNMDGRAVWLCKCDCGDTVEIPRNRLVKGTTTSCGCYRREVATARAQTHGLSKHKHLAWVYHAIKQRCYNSNNKSYKDYGERGIKMCSDWLDEHNGFKNFYNWAIEQGYDETKSGREQSVDRINNDGNYDPDNCRITTNKVQHNNTSKNRYYSYNGKTQTLSQWAEEIGMKYTTLYARVINYGWSIECALETPVNNK